MRLRQKFMSLASMMAAAIAVVCLISYYFASEELESTTDSELRMTVEREAAQLNGWLETKKAFGESTSNVLTSLNGDMSLLKTQKVLGTITSDKEILDMAFALEDKYIACYYAGDITGKLDPTTRAWFNNARDLDKAFFTAPYVDVN
ncbi:MAG: methyl-accepting chemotaxis protein, partial [Selenomonadaceae bacterium]|nr:methyl-accepting chemotaxis protein [Selenomonadaceae bacterium]